jgi:phage terminase small subunit
MAKTKAKSPSGKLTPKQALFVQEYLKDLNATQAAIRAGYSSKTAQVIGAENLTKPMVRQAIDTALAERSGRTQITADRVLQEIAYLAFSDLGQILDFSGKDPKLKPASEIPESARRAISSIKVQRHIEGRNEDARTVEVTEFKLWSKDASLEKLAKHLGLWFDKHKVEHTGPDGKPLQIEATITHDGSITLDAGAFCDFAKQVAQAGGPDLRSDDNT